jgi:hypothetical protein
MNGAHLSKVGKRVFLRRRASASLGLSLPSFAKQRDDGLENLLVLIRHLDKREPHIDKRARIFPAIQIGPHHPAFDDDLFPVGKLEDQLVNLVLRELLLAVDKNPAGSYISRLTLNRALAGNEGNRPVYIDSGSLASFAGINQILLSLVSLTASADWRPETHKIKFNTFPVELSNDILCFSRPALLDGNGMLVKLGFVFNRFSGFHDRRF